MAIPVDKLPALLKVPFLIPKFSKLKFIYPYHMMKPSNTVRIFYKEKAPLIKYYNPDTSLILEFSDTRPLCIEIFISESLVHTIQNGKNSDQIMEELTTVHENN